MPLVDGEYRYGFYIYICIWCVLWGVFGRDYHDVSIK